jgi:hypothetical protein
MISLFLCSSYFSVLQKKLRTQLKHMLIETLQTSYRCIIAASENAWNHTEKQKNLS